MRRGGEGQERMECLLDLASHNPTPLPCGHLDWRSRKWRRNSFVNVGLGECFRTRFAPQQPRYTWANCATTGGFPLRVDEKMNGYKSLWKPSSGGRGQLRHLESVATEERAWIINCLLSAIPSLSAPHPPLPFHTPPFHPPPPPPTPLPHSQPHPPYLPFPPAPMSKLIEFPNRNNIPWLPRLTLLRWNYL